ncbi:MAG: hypothetical protein IJ187_01230 [Neisseriaceae bacterium]|nr:hypothetical protein [Neisseriaceae bacterium]
MENQEKKTKKVSWAEIILFVFLGFIALFSILIYFPILNSIIVNGEAGEWGTFGDYFGGIVGTILAFGAFMLMKETLEVQKKEFNNQLKIFNQEQFETTFFKLLDTLNKYKNDENLMQLYLSLNMVYRQLYDYCEKNYNNKDKEYFVLMNKYNDIIKSNLDNDTLSNIFNDLNIHNCPNNLEIYNKIKNTIEQKGLFEFLKPKMYERQQDVLPLEFPCPENRIFMEYRLSAFVNNNHMIPVKIKYDYTLSEQELKEYIENCINNDDPLFYAYLMFNEEYGNKLIDKHILSDKINQLSLAKNDYSGNILLRDRNVIICMSEFVNKKEWNNFNIVAIENILGKIIDYFSIKTGYIISNNQSDVTQEKIQLLQNQSQKIFDLFCAFVEKIDLTNFSENDIKHIVKYLLNKLVDFLRNDCIIVTVLTHKIITSQKHNYGEAQKIVAQIYSNITSLTSSTAFIIETELKDTLLGLLYKPYCKFRVVQNNIIIQNKNKLILE